MSERREEIAEDVPAPAEDIPAPAPKNVPAPAEDVPAPHWRQYRNDDLTLQDQESQQEGTLGSQPAHIVTLTYRHYLDLD